jgi:hypothetical protein
VGGSGGGLIGAGIGGGLGLLGGLIACSDDDTSDDDDDACPSNVIPFRNPVSRPAPPPPPPPRPPRDCGRGYWNCLVAGIPTGECMDALKRCNETAPLPFLFPGGTLVQ